MDIIHKVRQEALFELLQSTVRQIMELNREVEPHNRIDIMALACHHRHAFEDLSVIDHTNCLTFTACSGSLGGIGEMIEIIAKKRPLLQDLIVVVAEQMKKGPADN